MKKYKVTYYQIRTEDNLEYTDVKIDTIEADFLDIRTNGIAVFCNESNEPIAVYETYITIKAE